ncbi:uncharacterized protein [Antedon mediterranea]|uniref:uncharacterized protein isoform X2 n=1 Tax=Antedon mediterranea TaxID=105859 RepID=UPI003AF53E02
MQQAEYQIEKADIDECTTNPCLNGATCFNFGGSYVCSCVPGYTGTDCETDIGECAQPQPCLNGGTYRCDCPPGYGGINCEINVNDCSPNPCLNGGQCTDLISDYNCSCQMGYSGRNCETNIDDCFGNPCVNGQCFDLVGGYVCSCFQGYTGINCDNIRLDQFCSNKINGYHYHPTYCNLFYQCYQGTTYPKTCQPGLVFNGEVTPVRCDYPSNVPRCRDYE